MKKLILATVIASLTSGLAIAESKDTDTEKDKGVRFSMPVGPNYDPFLEAAVAVIPTALYETTEGADTSKTSLLAAYGSNGNWVTQLDSENYFGSESQWLVQGMARYADMTIDAANQVRFLAPFPNTNIPDGPTSEVSNTTMELELDVMYKVYDKVYLGPSVKWMTMDFPNDGGLFSQQNFMGNTDSKSYGLKAIFDDRDSKVGTKEGLYLAATVQKSKGVITDGMSIYIPSHPLVPTEYQDTTQSNNSERNFTKLLTDFRYYKPLSDDLDLAWRFRARMHTDGANEFQTSLDQVAHGMTKEVAGRNAIGTDLQARYWLADRWAVGVSSSASRAYDALSEQNEDWFFAVGTGVRYVLLPEDGLVARLDVTYNTQEDDNTASILLCR